MDKAYPRSALYQEAGLRSDSEITPLIVSDLHHAERPDKCRTTEA